MSKIQSTSNIRYSRTFADNEETWRRLGTDQQGAFVGVDGGEPQLRVGAAAAFREEPDDDVLVSGGALGARERKTIFFILSCLL